MVANFVRHARHSYVKQDARGKSGAACRATFFDETMRSDRALDDDEETFSDIESPRLPFQQADRRLPSGVHANVTSSSDVG